MRGAADAEYAGKNGESQNPVAVNAWDGGWEKPLAETVSTTAFLPSEMGWRRDFSRRDAPSCKCLNPRL
jgi:hypothetical protein